MIKVSARDLADSAKKESSALELAACLDGVVVQLEGKASDERI